VKPVKLNWIGEFFETLHADTAGITGSFLR
jgi:hypothetical protein